MRACAALPRTNGMDWQTLISAIQESIICKVISVNWSPFHCHRYEQKRKLICWAMIFFLRVAEGGGPILVNTKWHLPSLPYIYTYLVRICDLFATLCRSKVCANTFFRPVKGVEFSILVKHSPKANLIVRVFYNLVPAWGRGWGNHTTGWPNWPLGLHHCSNQFELTTF